MYLNLYSTCFNILKYIFEHSFPKYSFGPQINIHYALLAEPFIVRDDKFILVANFQQRMQSGCEDTMGESKRESDTEGIGDARNSVVKYKVFCSDRLLG